MRRCTEGTPYGLDSPDSVTYTAEQQIVLPPLDKRLAGDWQAPPRNYRTSTRPRANGSFVLGKHRVKTAEQDRNLDLQIQVRYG